MEFLFAFILLCFVLLFWVFFFFVILHLTWNTNSTRIGTQALITVWESHQGCIQISSPLPFFLCRNTYLQLKFGIARWFILTNEMWTTVFEVTFKRKIYELVCNFSQKMKQYGSMCQNRLLADRNEQNPLLALTALVCEQEVNLAVWSQ